MGRFFLKAKYKDELGKKHRNKKVKRGVIEKK